MYEYSILKQKYKYIKKYCHSILKSNSIYLTQNYFEYCKQGNIEAVYYCILEGIDPEMFDKQNKGRNAFFYACEMNFKYMLQMLM